MWVGKSIFTRTAQRALALIGPEIRSVQSSFRLGPKDVPFLTGQKGDGKSRRADPRCGGRLGSASGQRIGRARRVILRTRFAQTSIRTAPRCVAWPPLAPHRERPGRRAGARTRPRTRSCSFSGLLRGRLGRAVDSVGQSLTLVRAQRSIAAISYAPPESAFGGLRSVWKDRRDRSRVVFPVNGEAGANVTASCRQVLSLSPVVDLNEVLPFEPTSRASRPLIRRGFVRIGHAFRSILGRAG